MIKNKTKQNKIPTNQRQKQTKETEKKKEIKPENVKKIRKNKRA